MKKAILIFLVVLILAGIAYLLFVHFSNKSKQDEAQKVVIAQQQAIIQGNCVPYTQKQYDDAVRILRNKCAPKLLIPIVGVGYYNKCMVEGKASLPEVNTCM